MIKKLLRKVWPAHLRSGGYMHGLVRKHTGNVIYAGPFQGMIYIDEAFCSALMPKLLGVYERELHNVVEELIHWQPKVVVDIGAAEGYYAAGLGMRLPSSDILTFESDPHAQQLLAKLASSNHCENIMSYGIATPQESGQTHQNKLEKKI